MEFLIIKKLPLIKYVYIANQRGLIFRGFWCRAFFCFYIQSTVNSEIFASVYIRETPKFRENNILAKSLSISDIGKSYIT